MSTTTSSVHTKNVSRNPATAMAASLPSDLSHSPLIGILGVILGAGIVTLVGRLLTLGLGDLKGGLGISSDQGAWIGTAFNVALMFIGPFTVYLGALLGTRKILLLSAAIFTIVSASLPLVHNYNLLIVLLVISGLTSGTFYPLTLTFALRNIPFRYLAITVALYATSVEGAVNFAPSLYGYYREHFSWEWMFWTSAIVTPVMMLCVYVGIPDSPKPKRSGDEINFVGFLYGSLGFAMVFAALDQGQRLDWWRSGLFSALLICGVFFLLCGLVSRFSRPNPLVDMPYLFKWNTVLLAISLCAFRFALLGTALVIPQSLAVHGFTATQYGSAVLWTAVPELFLTIIAAFFLNKGLDSRLLMATGFACIAFACLLNSDITSSWSAENYFPTELLMAVGQSFAFMGLVSTLLLQALFSGGLESPQQILTFSAFFHVTRLFGGQIGTAMMGHFIAEREKLHSFLLGLQLQQGHWVTESTVRNLTFGLAAKSSGLTVATGRAVGLVDGKVRLQAYSLTFIDAFHFIAWICVVILLLIAMLQSSPMNFGDLYSLPSGSQPDQGGRV